MQADPQLWVAVPPPDTPETTGLHGMYNPIPGSLIDLTDLLDLIIDVVPAHARVAGLATRRWSTHTRKFATVSREVTDSI